MSTRLKTWFMVVSAAITLSSGAAVHAQVVAAPAASVPPAASSAVWMMGEVHDNPQAHFFRLQDLGKALGGTWRPAILMEQFDTDRQDALTQAWQTCKDADCVVKQAGSASGWDWSFYKPLINLALQYRLPLVAGNLSREQAREVMKSGYRAVFDQKTIDQFGLDKPLAPALASAQAQAVDLGHCSTLDPKTVEAMVKGQVARDVNFAQLIQRYASQGVVLVAGNGHVRRDIGVLQWLSPELASRVVVSGYVEPNGLDATLFDRIRVVEPHQRPDPCKGLKQSMAR